MTIYPCRATLQFIESIAQFYLFSIEGGCGILFAGLNPKAQITILDVDGYPGTGQEAAIESRITISNVHRIESVVTRTLLWHFIVCVAMTKPISQQVEQFLQGVRPLSEREVKQLFPDYQIIHEKIADSTKSLLLFAILKIRQKKLRAGVMSRRSLRH